MTREDSVTESEMRSTLARILESEEFQSSPRIKDVLSYIVEKMLDGRIDEINETIIAYQVFKRTSDELDSSSSVVRVTMARLRRKLSHYYQSAGADDEIRIEIVAGSYAPVFYRIGKGYDDGPDSGTPAGAERSLPLQSSRSPGIVGVLIVLGIAVVVMGSFLTAEFMLHERYRQHYDPGTAAQPFLAVVGIDHDQEVGPFGRRFQIALTSDLAKVSAFRVMAPGRGARGELHGLPLTELGSRFGLSHLVTGVYTLEGQRLELDVQLQDTRTSQILWAERFMAAPEDKSVILHQIVTGITAALSVEIEPDEARRIALNHQEGSPAMTLYANAMRSLYPPDQTGRTLAGIEMLKEVTLLDPQFAGGYAGLALAYSQLVLYRNSRDPEADLEQAMAYADSAIELDADYGLGHSAKGFVYALSGDHARSVEESYRAVTLEPSDPITQMRFAVVLSLAGRYEEALSAVNETLRLDPLKTRTPYRNLRGVILYQLGRYDEAAASFDENVSLKGPRTAWIQLFHAMSYLQIGKQEEAVTLLKDVRGTFGNASPGYWIDLWFTAPGAAGDAKELLMSAGWDDFDDVP